MLDKIIFYCFALLFVLVPVFWTSYNFELFEYNKMMLVYGLTITITIAWIIKSIKQKVLILKRTPLDIPILLFLLSQILSTIFSIDQHTSVWGYYSRANGGLLSTISYILLYYGLISNIQKPEAIRLIKLALGSGVFVSLWAIMEHFGVSLSCVALRGEFNASCWIQDVQSRVFATLGQPNWLAAYLAMLIFPAFYFFLSENSPKKLIIYLFSLVALYLAFTFTYSRGGTLGFIAGIITFLAGLALLKPATPFWIRRMFQVLAVFILINLLFGSAITSFKVLQKFSPPPRPGLTQSSGTQLENGGTESGQIRLIVWRGALDIFKAYPILGSGVETFAYSYYNFRPIEHNMVSEWDFLYNKAHNEYLNYLATTGIIGFGAYLFMISSFGLIMEYFQNIKHYR
jgi:putative inorganic carbon (hco3(-)) transporter